MELTDAGPVGLAERTEKADVLALPAVVVFVDAEKGRTMKAFADRYQSAVDALATLAGEIRGFHAALDPGTDAETVTTLEALAKACDAKAGA